MSTILPAYSASKEVDLHQVDVQERIQQSKRVDSTGWHLFDDQAQWKAFSQRMPEGKWISHLKVQGMHCSACANRVEQAIEQIEGVLSASVDAVSSHASIVWLETAVKPSQWLSAVSSAGYSMMPLHGGDAAATARQERQKMLWRWLVAGFCMMQVMMYSWPYYGAAPGDIDPMSDQLLRWANLLLTLPVLLFSSGPFFRAAWSDLKHARVSMDLPVALGIGLTFAVSTAAVMDPAGMWGNELYFDSLTMLVFFLLTGRWLELRLKQEVAGQMEFGVGLLPVSAEVVSKTGATDTVPIDSLQVGDVIRVRTGETFAADGVVIFGLSEVDESVLTGESLPVEKAAGENVFAGTTNLSSPLEVRLTRLDAETRLGQMNRLMQCSLHTKPKIVQLADRVAKPFLLVVLMLAIAAILFWWPTDPQRGILAAIAILVVTCPCALALAAPTAFLSSSSCLAQHGLLVRDLTALERLDRVDHFVFDKTGTLTQSALSVSSAQALNGHSIEHVLAQAELLAQQSVHPVSMAVSQFVAGKLSTLTFGQIVSNVEEFAGFGVQAKIALKNEKPIICKLGSSRFCEVKEIRGDKRRVVYLSEDDTLIGAFYLDEKLRPDAGSTMISLKKLLHKTNPSLKSHLSIMSGDSENSVDSISRELQWDKARDQVKAECSASDKLAGLEHLRADGMHVAMVGDGINDSPVLAAADVSFAPVQGAALANIKADFVLTFNTLAPIAFAKRQATYTMTIVRQNLSWSIAYNLCCVPLALAGYLTPWMAGLGMAASSVLVLINSLRLKRIKG